MHVAGGGVGGLESIKLLTSFIQQMHEMKQGRIQDFSYVSQNFRSELDIWTSLNWTEGQWDHITTNQNMCILYKTDSIYNT